MKPTPTAQLLAEAAKTLYGDQPGWVALLSRDIQVNERTIYAWLSGKRDLMSNNTAMQRLEELLRREAQSFNKMADKIKINSAKPVERLPPRRQTSSAA